jgi:hypothetical protein
LIGQQTAGFTVNRLDEAASGASTMQDTFPDDSSNQ